MDELSGLIGERTINRPRRPVLYPYRKKVTRNYGPVRTLNGLAKMAECFIALSAT
jgi:hypothetical protein